MRHLGSSGNDFGVRFWVYRVDIKVAFQRDIIQIVINLFYSIDCISMLLVDFILVTVILRMDYCPNKGSFLTSQRIRKFSQVV